MNEKEKKSNLDFLLTVAGMVEIVQQSGEVLGVGRYVTPDGYHPAVHVWPEAWHKYFGDQADEKMEDEDSVRLWAKYRGLWIFCMEHKDGGQV